MFQSFKQEFTPLEKGGSNNVYSFQISFQSFKQEFTPLEKNLGKIPKLDGYVSIL